MKRGRARANPDQKKKPGSRSLFRREFPGPIVPRPLLPGLFLQRRWGRSTSLLFRGLGLRDDLPRTDSKQRLHLLFDLRHQRRAVLEVQLGVLTALADLLAVVTVP